MIVPVSESPIDAGRIRRIAGLTYRAAEAYIALGQRLLGASQRSQQPPSAVIAELDQVSEHLLGLAAHLARLAGALEETNSPATRTAGEADPNVAKKTRRAEESADPER